MTTIGIDPGISGAIAWWQVGELSAIVDMPVLGGRVNGYELAHLLAVNVLCDLVVIETPSTRPGQAAQATLTTGINYGIILGVLEALERPVRHVTPAKWCADLHLPRTGKTPLEKRKAKEARRLRCMELWPAQTQLFSRVKDDGRADAALIALWGTGQ